MALLSGIFEKRSSVSGGYALGDPALADLFGGGVNSASGQNVTSASAMRVSTVFACITILSQTLAMLPKHVKGIRPDGGKDILAGHRRYRQIHDRPNRWQSSFEFFEYMEGMRLSHGNAYALDSYYPGRKENELVPMDPARVWPFVVTPEGTIYYLYDNSPPPPAGSKLWYQYFPYNALTITLPADQVMHIRGYSTNGIVGMNPITKAAREAIGLAMATEEHGARLFSNGAQISKVFTHPAKLGDVAYKRMKDSLAGEFSGVSNANKTIILEEGMNIETLSMTSENAQFLETRKFQVEDIARIFNVPLILIGHGDKAPTYASAEQFFMSFKVHTMQPIATRWEQAMERSLLDSNEVGKVIFDFDMDSMMRGDSAARAAYLQARFNMASMTPDEIRQYEGENPSDKPEGQKLYLQSGMMPADMAGAKPIAPGAIKGVAK